MNINFKGGYFNFNFLNQIRLDFVQWVHGLLDIVQSAWTPWTLSRVSMDNVQTVLWVHGQCPLSPWTMSTESMDIVQSGWSHWTLSTDSLDFVQSIHGHCSDCPLSPWTMSRESTESMDFLQTDWVCTKFHLSGSETHFLQGVHNNYVSTLTSQNSTLHKCKLKMCISSKRQIFK